MEGFAPLLILLFFWVMIGIPVSIAKKQQQQQQQQKKAARDAAQQASVKDAHSGAPQKPAERLTTLTPSIAVTGHDDSIYRGSLNADTGEGYDPCHDEQMSSMPRTGSGDVTPVTSPQPSLPFGWTGSDMVRGIVMSEILKRK